MLSAVCFAREFMLFSSIDFIFIFLPVFLFIYWLLPARYSNLVLFAGSLCFYAYGEHVYFVLILISLLVHYSLTRYSYGQSLKVRRICLAIMLIYGFGTLFVFKYMGFFEANWNSLGVYLVRTGSSVKLPHLELPDIALPIGISFYTFQIAAYAIDMYRSGEEPEKSIVDLGAYLCMFPQLIAGPIVLYTDVAGRLKKRKHSWLHVENGLKTFIIGLSLKVIMANTFGILWNQIQTWGVSSVSVVMVWMGVLAYTFQIYFDFQGYSLMAMGLGEILGFRIPRNFNHPYTAISITDFWRRWHMTLSSWFRDYVYIPLGGSRRGRYRMLFNMLIVWAFTGLWHGASWNFVLWGLYYFVLLCFEKLILFPAYRSLRQKGIIKDGAVKPLKAAGWLYAFIAVMSGWVLFALDDLGSVRELLLRMYGYLGQKEAWMIGRDTLVLTFKQYWLYFLAGAVLCTPAPFRLYSENRRNPACVAMLVLLLAVCVYKLNSSASNPFLYFRF